MTVGSSLAASVSGLKASALRVNVAANNIVNQNTQGFKAAIVRATSVNTTPTPDGGSGVVAQEFEGTQDVDIALEFVRLIEAEIAYKASAKVIKTIEEIETETLNLIA